MALYGSICGCDLRREAECKADRHETCTLSGNGAVRGPEILILYGITLAGFVYDVYEIQASSYIRFRHRLTLTALQVSLLVVLTSRGPKGTLYSRSSRTTNFVTEVLWVEMVIESRQQKYFWT
jgi:hypothetical protein